MRVVRLQGVVRAAEERPDVAGVVLAGVEVGVVADAQREVQRDGRQGVEGSAAERGVVAQGGREGGFGCEDGLQVGADGGVGALAEGGEGVEGRRVREG